MDFVAGSHRNPILRIPIPIPKTTFRRIGMAIRYLTPNARQLVAERDHAMPARGSGTSGNFILVEAPARLFVSEALALYERIRSDQAKALAQGASSAVPLYQTAG